MEAGAELSYTHTVLGLRLSGRGRLLLVHENRDLSDWGASVQLRWEPRGAGLGPALSVAPEWGAPRRGVDALWQSRQEVRVGAGGGEAAAAGWLPDAVALRLSYVVAVPEGVVQPYAEVDLTAAAVRRMRAGAAVNLATPTVPGVRLEAFGQRSTRADGAGADYRLGLEGVLEY